MHSVFSWSTIRSFASIHLERLNINVSSMLQIPGKILSILYFVSFNTRRHIPCFNCLHCCSCEGKRSCSVSCLFGKVQNIDLMSERSCFNFLFVWKGCIFNNSLKTTSKNDSAVRLGINKPKMCHPALTNSFASRTVTSKWHCIWLSVLKLSELLLENLGYLSRFALTKAKAVGFRH